MYNLILTNVFYIFVFISKHQKYQHYAIGTGGFWEEFDVLQQWETKRDSTKDIGFLDENKCKNRYRNILPCKLIVFHKYIFRFLVK